MALTPQNPTPQKPAHEIEMERKMALLSKVRQNRTNALEGKGRIRPAKVGVDVPPDKHFVWVNRHETRVVYFQALGYVVCKDERITTDWKRDDGTHQYGDLILMEIDKELHQVLKLDSEMKALEGVEGEDLFKSFAERVGIPVSTPKN